MKNLTWRGYSAHFPGVIFLDLFSFLITCWQTEESIPPQQSQANLHFQQPNQKWDFCWPTLFIFASGCSNPASGRRTAGLESRRSRHSLAATTGSGSVWFPRFKHLRGENLSRVLVSNHENGCREQQPAGISKSSHEGNVWTREIWKPPVNCSHCRKTGQTLHISNTQCCCCRCCCSNTNKASFILPSLSDHLTH